MTGSGQAAVGRWQHFEGERLQCDLCPRHCRLQDGQRAFCFVRQRQGDDIVLTSYGAATGFCIDPIEKKPLNHFYPGSSVLSFGTAGCNLGCRFCQNWDISKARDVARLSERALPERIAAAARSNGCQSVAFTYNDPVIFAEYAIDTAVACREQGVKSVAVSAGYISDLAREPFFAAMDAANIDLKAFTERFYQKLCFAELGPVLDTLRYIKHETRCWLEVTTLLIPGENDSEAEVEQLAGWVYEHLGADVPLHFSAFHPDYKLTGPERTPAETCLRARDQAKAIGLHHVYCGNIHHPESQSTYCPKCQTRLIERDWYALGEYAVASGDEATGACSHCGEPIAGRFATEAGAWGRRRLPIRIE
ncbi:MAG: AmmeMemoRadiSam system radical SAM enzyme [Polyangiaceae bacterium]|nr:AmmeMemoRadiSam system radical SAM enzyme [Polyangiaceae bacterium]